MAHYEPGEHRKLASGCHPASAGRICVEPSGRLDAWATPQEDDPRPTCSGRKTPGSLGNPVVGQAHGMAPPPGQVIVSAAHQARPVGAW
eukprot:CAMPEP_0204497600 /NCGR_PEP_ID=MMETSP0471-20130131/91163_1 /ASSEMBLY_ACC=CAM_ASM_000602 /TAXON_ID=2969 /ORGANISM="Oxyrrhis marina" /LENGTH=88 /DNA_ID=CAMNT_0051502013 /DNA_START=1071 /DNA_END=1334 /DNA_ORIENTATION=-